MYVRKPVPSIEEMRADKGLMDVCQMYGPGVSGNTLPEDPEAEIAFARRHASEIIGKAVRSISH